MHACAAVSDDDDDDDDADEKRAREMTSTNARRSRRAAANGDRCVDEYAPERPTHPSTIYIDLNRYILQSECPSITFINKKRSVVDAIRHLTSRRRAPHRAASPRTPARARTHRSRSFPRSRALLARLTMYGVLDTRTTPRATFRGCQTSPRANARHASTIVTRAAVVDAASVSTPFDVAGARAAVARTQGKVRLMSPGGPTPLERAPRLSEALGVDLYIKRDDCTGLASGGNKTRKLEYLLAQALEMYPDGDCVVMTQGATQSNHARQTAAAAAKLGMKCHILLENRTGRSDENYTRNGNVLLDDLFGATRESRPSGMNMNEELERVADEWRARGEKVFTIVGGGSCPTGALGYVEAALEFTEQAAEQLVDFDYFVHATGSAGTQAGLAVGFGLIQSPVKLLGFGVRMPKDIQETNVFNLATRTAAGLGLDPASVVTRDDIVADSSYVGQGYGIPAPSTIDAIRMFATHEGILLDPVYSGKGAAGLIDYAKRGLFPKGAKVCFLHTGGAVSLHGYLDAFVDDHATTAS